MLQVFNQSSSSLSMWLFLLVLFLSTRGDGRNNRGFVSGASPPPYDEEEAKRQCLPTDPDVYDYIIVGAGTAGSAAAGELAVALPNASILLIDQGTDRSDSPIVMDNDQFANIIESPYCEHKFTSEVALKGANPFSNDRKIYGCISNILGGASSINYGGWYRPPQSDLDEWANLVHDDSWSYDSMLPYFHQLEQLNSETPKYSDRGYDGYIPIRATNVSIIHYHTGMIDAIDQHLNVPLGSQDNNLRDQTGISSLQVTRERNGCWTTTKGSATSDGEEEELCANEKRLGSAYNVFVRDRQRNPDGNRLPNLYVLEGAKVVELSGVAKDDDSGNDIIVEHIQKGWRSAVKAKHEVLLSAGAWGNPKIAMLSGIGDPNVLSNANVDTVIDLPGVGKNFKDHGVLWMTAILNNVQVAPTAPATENRTNATDTTATDTFDITSFSGVNQPLPALLAGFNTINMFFKSNETLEYPDMELLSGVNPAGPTSAIVIARMYQNKGSSGTMGGTLKLRSDDPYEDMDVTRNWYADSESIDPMLSALKRVISMLRSIGAVMLSPNQFSVDLASDDELLAYLKDNVVSEMHFMGSMKMGTVDDNMAVVDSSLKVIGSNGRLRVADTSIFPTDIRGHPMATAMGVGMRAAELIANDYVKDDEVSSVESESDGDSSPANCVAITGKLVLAAAAAALIMA